MNDPIKAVMSDEQRATTHALMRGPCANTVDTGKVTGEMYQARVRAMNEHPDPLLVPVKKS